MNTDDSWRSPHFRSYIIAKIEETIQQVAYPAKRTSSEIETSIFNKSGNNKEAYLGFVARMLLHLREMNRDAISSRKRKASCSTRDVCADDTVSCLQEERFKAGVAGEDKILELKLQHEKDLSELMKEEIRLRIKCTLEKHQAEMELINLQKMVLLKQR